MQIRHERLTDGWTWWRIADRDWRNPLDPGFAKRRGGRWNPPGSYATLYLNEDQDTARINLRAFIADWPYEPEDLRADTGPVLVGARLPRRQRVADAHSAKGLESIGLPKSYPLDANGRRIPREPCQRIGEQVKALGLRGVRTRPAQARDGSGRELAWFPATVRSAARRVRTLTFDAWFWA